MNDAAAMPNDHAEGVAGAGLVRAALRRPLTVVVLVLAVVMAAGIAVTRMPVDIFPDMGVPIIYVAQPYGGMDPAQMEGFLTNYYEYHFLYVTGIEHVESRNIQGVALMKLFFHPGTNMSQAMAEVIAHVNRSRSFMPTGTVPPFVMRFDAGSVPVGFLVFSSETKTIREIQDQALFKVRPMFASLPGVSAPPPFGGNQRTIVVRVDPDKLHSYHLTPDEVTAAVSAGNIISPSGNVRIGDLMPMVRVNSVARDLAEFDYIPVRKGNPAVFLRDIATIEDSADIASGYALVDGRRTVYIPVTKRSDASTLAVVGALKEALPKMRAILPEDIQINFEFDQSPYVTRAMTALVIEGLLGAGLTGLMVLLFLRDWRSALVVVLNIPLAILAAVFALWLSGQTINIMTLGGLALAIGILVDEATVAIENIHTRQRTSASIARAALIGCAETAVPRLLAMLCVLAVFIPSLFMVGTARAMFVPLSLAVGFSMVASYLLSSTLVPILSTWLLQHKPERGDAGNARASSFDRLCDAYAAILARLVAMRWIVIPAYALGSLGIIFAAAMVLQITVFPSVDAGQFQLRMRAPDGTRIEKTEALALQVLKEIETEAGTGNIAKSISYVGAVPPSYPINTIYLWMSGPHEAVMRVALKPDGRIPIHELKRRLRDRLAQLLPNVQFSFEAGDIVTEVLSLGSPTPIEIGFNGPNLAANREYAEKVRIELARVDELRDLQFAQSLEYPIVDVTLDRARAGFAGVSAAEVARSMVAATSSSRFVVPNYWADPKTGIGYQVQIEIPFAKMDSLGAVETIPVRQSGGAEVLLRDVADVKMNKMPGEYSRYNMQRMVTLRANMMGDDLAGVARKINDALARTGPAPQGVTVNIRGQIPLLRQMATGLVLGLALAVVVILLVLAAYFQSWRLAFIVVSTVPAVLAGVGIALLLTKTTLNVQSFMGAIMAVGVAVANAILLVTIAERDRLTGQTSADAAVSGARARLRPILMTSAAMIAGMVPTALGLGETGEQVGPLGRAVIGGLAAATLATLVVLPAVFALIQRRAKSQSASLDPDDLHSRYFDTANAISETQSRDSSRVTNSLAGG